MSAETPPGEDSGNEAGAPAQVAEQPSETPRVIAPPAAEPKPDSDRPKVAPDTVFTGAMLRQIREAQRLTLKELSSRTKISVASLGALEEERFEDLPNARVYVRGFVRCLAHELALDKDHVSQSYVPRWERWFESHS